MKPTLIVIIAAFISIVTSAQIKFEHLYAYSSTQQLRIVHFSSSKLGYKYAVFQQTGSSTGTIQLYNLNHSLYKTITIPPSGQPKGTLAVLYISDSLFNTTTADIEYMLEDVDSTYYLPHIRIYNDSGTTLFSKDSVLITWEAPQLPSTEPIFYTPNGYKMILSFIPTGGSNVSFGPDVQTFLSDDTSAYVYSLPGALPCNECSNGVITGLIGPENNGGNNQGYLKNPYPNPANNNVVIGYGLPEGINQGEIIFYNMSGQEIKQYTVDKTFNTLNISTTDLASGTYLYILKTAMGNVGSKKVIVIK
jgi:hypothetical protein